MTIYKMISLITRWLIMGCIDDVHNRKRKKWKHLENIIVNKCVYNEDKSLQFCRKIEY